MIVSLENDSRQTMNIYITPQKPRSLDATWFLFFFMPSLSLFFYWALVELKNRDCSEH
jgi:hypothetical protein